MKFLLGGSSALLLAAAMAAAPASAQTMAQPSPSQPMAPPYAGETSAQSYSSPAAPQSSSGAAVSPSGTGIVTANQPTTQAALPRGPYLNECKDVRMLQDTLTAFCPRGDGTWQTTQLLHGYSCTSGIQNAGGDLICETPQVGSATPPESYSSSSGGTYQDLPAPLPHYGAFGTGPQPMATVTYPANTATPNPGYVAPSNAGDGTYGYNAYPAAPPVTPYPYPAVPPANPYPPYPPAPPAPQP